MNLNLIKFYYTMGYFPTQIISNQELILKYRSAVFFLIKEFISKLEYNSYTRKYCIENLRLTDKALKNFFNENESLLTNKEVKFIKGLLNLLLQLKRFVLNHSAKYYPGAISNLTTTELKLYIQNLSKKKVISPKIIFLEDSYYETLYTITFERAIVNENLIFTTDYSDNILKKEETLYKKDPLEFWINNLKLK